MQTQRQNPHLFLAVITAASGLALWLAQFPLADWRIFLLAAQQPFDPYATQGFYNPPWVMWFVWPLTLPVRISPEISVYLARLLIVVVFAMLVQKRGGKVFIVLLALTSAPVVAMVVSANVDWLLALALLPGVERSLALPLLLIKPQIGLGVALVWLKAQWRSEPRGLARCLFPTGVVFCASFVVYGGWPLELLRAAELNQASWNIASFFPWGVLFGFILLWRAVKLEDEVLALLAMPLLTPYMAIYSVSVLYAVWAARASLKANLLAWLLSWACILALAVWQ